MIKRRQMRPAAARTAVRLVRESLLSPGARIGVFLPLDLSKPVTLEKLTKNIRPFASIM